MEARDLIVLGGGPGGYTAAIRSAQLGRRVTLVEQDALGGVCLNWGCIPSKALLQSAGLYQSFRESAAFGITATQLHFDFPAIIDRSRAVAAKLSQGVAYLMKKNKVEVVLGRGELQSAGSLAVTLNAGGHCTYSYQDIIIATGGRPAIMPEIVVDGEVIHSSRTILASQRLPQRLLIVGAGAIGLEFAYFFNSFGVQVTVVELLDQILPNEDFKIAAELTKILTRQGLIIKTSSAVHEIQTSGKTVRALIKSGDSQERWSGDSCLVAVGVKPNTNDIGLEKAGIETKRGFISVDEFMRCPIPHHFAIGDVSGPPLLAHKASHEALVAAAAANGDFSHPMHYDNIPACTYCRPQVASVGLSEQKAKELNLKYRSAVVPFTAIGKAIAIGETDGMVKVLLAEQTDELLGLHILHAEATELITAGVAFRELEAVGDSVLATIHPHPTLSEGILEAVAAALGRPINT